MMTYNRGDITLFALHFTDGSKRQKNRPTIIISTDEYHQTRGKAVLVAVTTRVEYSLPGDWIIRDWRVAGLRAPSRALAVIETVNLDLLGPVLGKLSEADLRGVESSLRSVLGL
jgi:mRNA-degrading endonuclease toxin of MazEF toxin-antitoxin module